MNPLQFQADMLRQWLGWTTTMTTAALTAWSHLGRQTAAALSKGGLPGYSVALPWPMPGWLITSPMGASGLASWMGPFATQSQSSLPIWPEPPWAALMQAMMAAQAAPPAPWNWVWPINIAPTQSPWWSTGRLLEPRPETLVEQIAANYRTATGYAVATVLGPFGTALEPRTFGQPWWQTYQRMLH